MNIEDLVLKLLKKIEHESSEMAFAYQEDNTWFVVISDFDYYMSKDAKILTRRNIARQVLERQFNKKAIFICQSVTEDILKQYLDKNLIINL